MLRPADAVENYLVAWSEHTYQASEVQPIPSKFFQQTSRDPIEFVDATFFVWNNFSIILATKIVSKKLFRNKKNLFHFV